ncbi:undecaprenyldiphospho-muramoylpentapeptide beta-N-acetylglucosaminyltransferase [Nitrospirillum sp. BR 11163]|uniref:undecaprenyldiphospho-muramoylpentapeptide beta-N-acetylglucosaminyltransferase n=1 Tax=Nitrospirillum sp. BR 11163 TaxID=3104323 RepID=UPI002AFE3E6C|nr:undecaprenyldiphospho-muramoylpentapeptide beta-N-acetylglucosaminyltransferase [Nitrospirillum sp. BR 11163]MEA1676882.1 undecaprenyldiphospho-muramoylpentapeptide beta-N-acetylglucosaminyltransferase [Nitrospirillum sp. BR 11163]
MTQQQPPIGPIVLAAGGTGGHLFPAEALARSLRARGLPVVLVTDTRGHAFGEGLADIPVHRVSAGTPGRGLVSKARTALSLLAGTVQARRILKDLKPAAVVGFGGYPSVPTVFAAQRLGLPVVLHEQNAVMGRANKMLAGGARLIATSFPQVSGLPRHVASVRTGNPVRPAILDLANRPYTAPTGTLSILVTGGSQGASVFSAILPAAVARLSQEHRLRLRIVQQARPETMEQAREGYAGLGVDVELAPFFRDMAGRLDACHLAICRSGAGTVAELAVAGRPAILVPYPQAMDDHQTANAKALVEAGGAWLMPHAQFTAEALAERLGAFLDDPAPLVLAAAGSRSFAIPDAADRLADAVLHVANGGRDA